jgi:hypothetical protein
VPQPYPIDIVRKIERRWNHRFYDAVSSPLAQNDNMPVTGFVRCVPDMRRSVLWLPSTAEMASFAAIGSVAPAVISGSRYAAS